MKIVINNKNLSMIFMTFFCFFSIFSPQVVGRIPILYVSFLFMLTYVVFFILSHGMSMCIKKDLVKVFYGFIPFLFYVFVKMVIDVASSDSSLAIIAYTMNFRHVLVAISFVFVALYFFSCFLSNHKNITKINFISIFIVVALIQFFCILLSYFSSSIQSFFIGFVLRNGLSDITIDAVSNNINRAYGFSGYYFDSLAYVISGLSVVVFSQALYSKSNVLMSCSIMVLLATSLTARTGIILAFVGYVIVCMHYFKGECQLRREVILKFLVLILIIIMMVHYGYRMLPDERKIAFETSFVDTQSLLMSGEMSGIYSHILLADLVFPKEILFGIGAKPETLGYFDMTGHFIDNGYVQVLWRFGLIGLVLLLYGYIFFFYKIYTRSFDGFSKSIVAAFAAMIALYYLKNYPLSKYGANFVFMVLPLVMYAFDSGSLHLLKLNVGYDRQSK